MKIKILLSILLVTTTVFSNAQDSDRFVLNGNAISIVKRFGITGEEKSGVLRCGDELKIYFDQVGVMVDVIHRGKLKNLISSVPDIENNLYNPKPEDLIIEVFEYDFDGDNVNEIIIIESQAAIDLNIYVFRYSQGLSELVGKFKGQFEIIISGRVIDLPYGSHGLTNTYCYYNGDFYELVRHFPK